MLHTKSRVPHVDLAFEDLSHIEGQFQGLVGQFYGKGLTVTESDDRNKAVLRIGSVNFYCLLHRKQLIGMWLAVITKSSNLNSRMIK